MLDYVAPIILLFAFVTMFYGIIAIHDIPYEISVRRNHPHQDAIHVAGWISLFTLHAIWPFLWIWATIYRQDIGWGFAQSGGKTETTSALRDQLAQLEQRLEALEQSSVNSSANNIEPSANDKKPSASDKEPSANDKKSSTDSKEPSAGESE